MKKYISCIAMAILSVSLLTGCSSGIELSDEENDMVAEYMAAALLKYDSEYEKELIYVEQIEEEEDNQFVLADDTTEESNKEETQNSNGTQTSNKTEKETSSEKKETASVSLDKIFDSSTYKIEYVGMKECTTYKEDGNEYFVVEAPSGSKLAVAQFKITNTSSKDIKVEFAEKNIVYSFLGKNPLLTALTGDLQYYSETIPANKSKMAVVLFAVNKDTDISGGTLTVAKKGQSTSSFTVAVSK